MKLFITSTAIVPPDFRGTIRFERPTPNTVRGAIATHKQSGTEIVSFVGHQDTADWLGVEMNRGEMTAGMLSSDDCIMGIRPRRRPQPGEEMPVNEQNFAGFTMHVL